MLSVGLACFFYSTSSVAVSKRFFRVELPTVIKARLTTIWAAERRDLKRQLIQTLQCNSVQGFFKNVKMSGREHAKLRKC